MHSGQELKRILGEFAVSGTSVVLEVFPALEEGYNEGKEALPDMLRAPCTERERRTVVQDAVAYDATHCQGGPGLCSLCEFFHGAGEMVPGGRTILFGGCPSSHGPKPRHAYERVYIEWKMREELPGELSKAMALDKIWRQVNLRTHTQAHGD
mmetsp:Transcript_27729/g.81083  ORF Transcript_27729/g.81083 Transcript_27729/m.81083 type:complete len:153 (-) Transcript_27729:735-1193(-)